MKWKEMLFVILMIGGFLVPVAIVGQWWLFGVFIVFFGCFGGIEAISVLKTGQSVSQKFWEYSKEHKAGAWTVLGSMLVGWLALLWHLAAKLL